MVLINKIRDHLKENKIVVELDHFDKWLWIHESTLNELIVNKNIFLNYDLKVTQVRSIDCSYDNAICECKKINSMYLGDYEVRLNDKQYEYLKILIESNIQVI